MNTFSGGPPSKTHEAVTLQIASSIPHLSYLPYPSLYRVSRLLPESSFPSLSQLHNLRYPSHSNHVAASPLPWKGTQRGCHQGRHSGKTICFMVFCASLYCAARASPKSQNPALLSPPPSQSSLSSANGRKLTRTFKSSGRRSLQRNSIPSSFPRRPQAPLRSRWSPHHLAQLGCH